MVLVATGATTASFAVTAGFRVAAGRPWASGRSRCDHCAVPLAYHRSIPVFSYALSGGRCRGCQGPITLAHPLAEIMGAVLLPICLTAFEPLRGCLIFSLAMLLLAASMVDLKTLRLPDTLTAGVGAACLALSMMEGMGAAPSGLAAAAATVVLLQALRLLSKRQGRDPGLGFGDVKLLAALALWLGVTTPWAVLLASASGLVVILTKHPTNGRLPFGPFIAASSLIVGALHDAGLLGIIT